MSKTVDQKVVEMRFDNKNFEKNVSKTMSTLDKLKTALKFQGASKGLEDVERRANTIKFHGLANTVESLADKFSGLQMVGTMAMMKISQSAADAGIRMIKGLSVDNVLSGWEKLQQKANSMSTLISQGYKTEVVEEQLEKLNWFSDETSYNFTDMIDNIAKFTATGKGLEDSVTAMQGIALWAAKSGQNAQKASGAMYQLSQALGAGVMRKEDWKSIQNASMDTQEFRQQAIDTAIALGTLKKVGKDTYQTLTGNKEKFHINQFAENLTEGQWFTSDVMMAVYKKYATASDQMKKAIDLMDSDYDLTLTAGEMIKGYDALKNGTFDEFLSETEIDSKEAGAALKDLISKFDEFGISTFRAGQEYRTFNDAIDATKDAVSTKWMNIFETLIGNVDEQKALWSMIGEKFYEWFAEPLDNLQALLNRWVDFGGRDSFHKALSNLATAIGSFVKPIKDAWNEIFPPMTAKRLSELTEKFKEFTSKLIIGEKTSNALYNAFKGLFSVIKTAIHIVGTFASAIFKLVSVFLPLGKGIVTVIGKLGEWTDKAAETIRKSDLLAKVLNTITTAVKNFAKSIGDFLKEHVRFDKMINMFKTLFEVVSKAALAIGKFFGQLIRNGDIKNVADIVNAGLLGGLIKTITDFVKKLKGTAEAFKGFSENMKGMLEDVRGILQSYQKSIDAKTLMTIAKAVALLAGSLLVLSLINPERLGSALTAMTLSMAELLGMFKLFSKMGESKIYLRTSLGLVAMASAVLIMATALKKLSGLSWNQMMTGLVGIAASLGMMVYALKKMPDMSKVVKKTSSLIAMSTALLIVSAALKVMSTMSLAEIGKSMLAMAGSLAIMVTALNKMNPEKAISKTLALFVAANALILLSGALKLLSTMSWSDIGRSLTAMGGALAILIIALNKMNSGNKIASSMGLHVKGIGSGFSKSSSKSGGAIGKSIALIGATMALVVLGGALKLLATMSWSDIGRSLTAMGGALTLLVIAMKIMGSSAKSAFTGAGSLIIAANALVVLGLALKLIGSMSVGSIVKSLVTLAGTFVILSVAGALLSKVAPALLGVAGAMALFGIGAVAFGAGLILISSGISALALALAGGATAIVAGLGAILLGILGLVPEIVKIIGEVLIGLADLAVELAPKLAKAIMLLIYESIKAMAEYTPMIVTEIMNLIINVLRAVADRAPELIVAVVEVINAIFKGFVEALKILDPKTLVVGIACVGMLAVIMHLMASLAAIAPMALVGILAFGVLVAELALVIAAIGRLSQIDGINELVGAGGNLLMEVGTAIGKFIGGIIGGVATGVSTALPGVATNLSDFMTNLQPFLEGVKNIDLLVLPKITLLSAAILLLSAAGFVSGILQLLSFGNSLGELGTQLSEFMDNAQGFIDGANNINPSIVESVGALAGALLALTAANLINNLSNFISIFTGGSSLSEFGEEIESLGTSMRKFSDNLGTFDDSQVSSIKCACDAIVALSKAAKQIPNSGGVAGFFAGENDVDVWGQKLPKLAEGLNSFVTALGTFNEAQIKVAECAAQCVVVMAKAANEIPNTGGLVSWFTGDNDISVFAGKLPGVGTYLNQFITNLGTFDENSIATVKCAADVIAAMAQAANEIPNTGGLVSWFTGDNDISEFADKLPDVGTHLAKFIENVGEFGPNSVATALCAANVVSTMAKAANSIPNTGGLKSWFTGDNDISKFVNKLPNVGTKLGEFVANVGAVSPDTVNTANCAANVIAVMAQAAHNSPSTGGLVGWFTGENDITLFASKLPGTATYLKEFIENIGSFNPDTIATAQCAANVIATMADAANNVPNTGGIVGWFTGEKDISTFSEKLPGVGTSLSEFITNLGTFTTDQLNTATAGANALSALAKAANDVPDTGGLKSWFTGDKDISAFADKLPKVATGISGYIKNLGNFDSKKIDAVNASTGAIKAICELSKIDVDKTSKVAGELSGKLTTLGDNLSKFANNVSATDKTKLETAIANTNTIINMLTSAANLNVESLSKFTDSLKAIGENGVSSFVEAFQGENPKTKVSQAIRDLIDKLITSAETKRRDMTDKFTSLATACCDAIKTSTMYEKMKEAGKYFTQGFAEGISSNQYLVTTAGSKLGNAAYDAAKRAIDAHSPSKKAHKLGNFFGLGFVNGIKEYQHTAYSESTNMADEAKKGLTNAISTMDRLLNNGGNNQPTIRPVLDLSDVESGASTIGNMLSQNANVAANLNAISSGFKQRSQNGRNDDVVSAIKQLGSNIGNGGNTYNLGDISYNDDTPIANAVKDLVRAVNIERRT